MFYSVKDLRHIGKWIYRARRILHATLVASMQYEDGPAKIQELVRLQERFNGAIKSLPVWLRSERFLVKHVTDPAKRELDRRGLLAIAKDLREVAPGEWKP